MDGQLDVAMVSMLEQKFEKSRFTRVDSDVIDHLIAKEERKDASLKLANAIFYLPYSAVSYHR